METFINLVGVILFGGLAVYHTCQIIQESSIKGLTKEARDYQSKAKEAYQLQVDQLTEGRAIRNDLHDVLDEMKAKTEDAKHT